MLGILCRLRGRKKENVAAVRIANDDPAAHGGCLHPFDDVDPISFGNRARLICIGNLKANQRTRTTWLVPFIRRIELNRKTVILECEMDWTRPMLFLDEDNPKLLVKSRR